jgi:hypothetical protein
MITRKINEKSKEIKRHLKERKILLQLTRILLWEFIQFYPTAMHNYSL